MSLTTLLLVLDLIGTFAFALNGALTAIKVARLDVVGVVTLAIITAIGGGIMRDVLIGDVPPAAFQLWYYLAVSLLGGLLVFAIGHRLNRLRVPILILDAAGLSLFAVVGSSKALDAGLGILPAILLGILTGVGGGTLRDLMTQKLPTVLHSELYVIPALIAAICVVVGNRAGLPEIPTAIIGAILCFAVRGFGLKYRLNAPRIAELERHSASSN